MHEGIQWTNQVAADRPSSLTFGIKVKGPK